jgi:hypothetical protein
MKRSRDRRPEKYVVTVQVDQARYTSSCESLVRLSSGSAEDAYAWLELSDAEREN